MENQLMFRDYMFMGSRSLNLSQDSFNLLMGILGAIHAETFSVQQFKEEFGLDKTTVSDVYKFITNGNNWPAVLHFGERCYSNARQELLAAKGLN